MPNIPSSVPNDPTNVPNVAPSPWMVRVPVASVWTKAPSPDKALDFSVPTILDTGSDEDIDQLKSGHEVRLASCFLVC